ncbi:MAG: glycosyltransferase family protein [Ignavibacteriales bacterium]|nr:glycosyltransferase family protein [Ignavibacteriales bacterium]MCF8316729.1 glycosyltransferase family protein [Ignavibacteriales bacterium]MCF8436037.1 glycosyltransferase family protein [Ignavibacteriales bacterium]
MNILTVIQARTESTRLPNKVFLSLAGAPLLQRQLERVQASRLSGKVIVATTENRSDNTIEKLCNRIGTEVFRGDADDLLDRHYHAALKYKADAVVKIPSDCPLIDPGIIDCVIGMFIRSGNKYDYLSNLHPASFPDGNDVEIMSFKSLENAWHNAKESYEREHTTPYLWEHPEIFRIGNYLWEGSEDLSMKMRWTIDYEEDYLFIRSVYDELYPGNKNFGLYDILNLLERKPYLNEINKKYAGRYWYENHLSELKTIENYKAQYRKVVNGFEQL